MKIKVVVHEADEGGFWAEVPAIPGCATQGETFEELLENLFDLNATPIGRIGYPVDQFLLCDSGHSSLG